MSKKKWQDEELGGVIKEPGSTAKYATGRWAEKKLIWDKERCINCNLCWTQCPDNCILNDKEGNMVGVNNVHCKSCGMCVEICPVKCLSFKEKKKEEI